MRHLAAVLIVGVLMLGLAPAALAQGCAMCRAAAAAADQPGQNALNLAILVLLIPTTSIFVGILIWAFRRRERTWDDAAANELPTTVHHLLDDSSLPLRADQ